MYRSYRDHRRLLLAGLVTGALVACGGSDPEQESTGTEPETTVDGTDATPTDDDAGADSAAAPDPIAVEACLEEAGLTVLDQGEVDPSAAYTDEQLDFFDLETALLVEAGDTEFISGTINFYRTTETADTQEVAFEESVTDYTVGRAGTVVYTLVGGTESGEVDTVTAIIDGCLTGESAG